MAGPLDDIFDRGNLQLPGPAPWEGGMLTPQQRDDLLRQRQADATMPAGTMPIGTVPIPGFQNQPPAQGNVTPISGTYTRYRTPTANDPSTWENAPIPAGNILRHGSNFDLLPDTQESRLGNHLAMAREFMRNNADEQQPNREFRGALPGLMRDFTNAEHLRLNGIQQLGTVQGVPNVLGSMQLNQAGQLGYRRLDGTWVPGSNDNANRDVETRRIVAENTPRGEDVAADQAAERSIQEIMRLRGMNEADAVTELRRQNPSFRTPRRLGGPGGAGGHAPNREGITTAPPGTVPLPPPWAFQAEGAGNAGENRNGVPIPAAGAPDINAQRASIANMFADANNLIPTTAGANGAVRRTYNDSPNEYHHAITRIMEQVPEDYLRRDMPHFQQQLASQFGGNEALDQWVNQNNVPIANLVSPERARQQRAIRRYLQMAGMGQSAITPLTENAGLWARGAAALNTVHPAGWAGSALNYFGLNPGIPLTR